MAGGETAQDGRSGGGARITASGPFPGWAGWGPEDVTVVQHGLALQMLRSGPLPSPTAAIELIGLLPSYSGQCWEGNKDHGHGQLGGPSRTRQVCS